MGRGQASLNNLAGIGRRAREEHPSVSPPKPEVVLEYTRPPLYAKQSEAIFDPRRISAIEASTKSGKTSGCIAWLFEQALGARRPGQNYWWVAPVSQQADIAFRRTCRAVPRELYEAHLGLKTVTLPHNDAVMWFKSGDNPDTLYGEDVFAAVVDEASRTKPEVWHALRSTLTATRGPVRIIGNVKGRRNWFYELARAAQRATEARARGDNDPDPTLAYHKLIAADAVEAGVLSAQEVEEARGHLPELVWRELYLAEPADDQGNPFGLAHIRGCVAPLSTADPVVWGWDLAKKQDWTVGIALDSTCRVCRLVRFQADWEQTFNRVTAATGRVPALVDSTGVGDPIVERLQRVAASRYEGFQFTAQSKQKLMEGLAVAIQHRNVTFPLGPIVDELEIFEYVYTPAGGVRYAAPEEYGAHDDCVMALALAVQHRAGAPAPMRITPEVIAAAARRPSGRVGERMRFGMRLP